MRIIRRKSTSAMPSDRRLVITKACRRLLRLRNGFSSSNVGSTAAIGPNFLRLAPSTVKVSCPTVDRLLTLSGTALASMIRRREATSPDVVDAHIRRMELVTPRLNEVVHERFDRAREEARRVDRAIAEGEEDLPPFAGVPCSIKECFRLDGMPNTSGLIARMGIVSEGDAPTVARLREVAGAI